jgi:flagellar hook-length control protein FliK
LPLPLPLPLPEASAATEQVPLAAGHPAATTTRKGDASNRQRPAQAGASAQAVASVILSVQGMPLAAPPNEPAASPATAAKPHPLTPAIETATAAAKNPVNGAPTPHVAAPEAVEPQPAAPNGPAPAAHDGVGVQATLPARPEAQLAADPSSALLAASTPPAPAAAAGPIAATAAAPPRTPAASPAEQVAPALVSLAHAPDGTQRLTLRLDPPDLGHVQIRIDRPPEAPARVDITVEKAETLTLLLRDQPQLQRALDQAGVPPDGRSVTFHVASTEPTARHEAVSAPSAGTGSAGTGDASYGASQQGGGPPRREFAGADDPDTEFSQAAPPGWVRAGLDITA